MRRLPVFKNPDQSSKGSFAVFGTLIFILVFLPISVVIAGPFAPGDTLDPGCTPGTAACKVLQLNAATSTSNFGVGTTTPWARFSIAGVAGTSTTPLFSISSSTIGATTTVFHITAAGDIGIGTTSPYAKLSVVGEGVFANFSATSTAATSTIAGGLNVGSGAITYDYSGAVTSIDYLQIGATSFDTDAGVISWVDLPISTTPSSGTPESYSAQIDGTPVLTVYGEANGTGGAQNLRVGIGTTSPYATLSVVGETVSQFFTATSSTATSTIAGSLAIGTTTMQVSHSRFIVGSATTTFLSVNINSGKIGIGMTNPTLGPLEAISGAYMTVGGVWTNASSRDLKENFTKLDGDDILQKINSLDISEWNYKLESPGVKHIGPIAQDFYKAFGLGGSPGETSISSIDPAGVALVGIQALSKKIDTFGGLPSTSFAASVLSALDQMGASVSNGLARFRQIMADALSVKTLCLEDVCVTRDQLKELLDRNGVAPAPLPQFAAISPSATSTSSLGLSGVAVDIEPPTITVNGASPAWIKVGDRYIDLGAVVTDNVSNNLGLNVFGAEVDTSAPGTYEVIYTAVDQVGNHATTTRQVIVEPRSIEVESGSASDPVATSTTTGS